jgi:serine/threonine-protein kinase
VNASRSDDLLSGWLRTGGLLQSALVRDLVAAESLDLAPGTRIGAWRVLEEIGRGGMGVVFRAERADGAYRQDIALKLIDGKAVRDEQRALFVRERQMLAELEHPGIVRLLDGGEWTGGQPWFALELVRGEPIDAYAQSHALPLPARIALLIAVADAIGYAHRRLVIHRDLKPANVFVDTEGRVKLLDFGIAGLARDRDSAATGFGTRAYASPEQCAGAAPSTGDDVYALGRLLDTLAGETTSAELRSIIARATAQNPDRRYASVDAFADDVRALRDRRPVATFDGGITYRLRKRIARHPLATAAVTASVAIIAGFMIALAQQRSEALNETARARAISRFLNDDVLANANPLVSGDKDLSVRAALDRAAKSVESTFSNDSSTREDIEMTLARSYEGIGAFDAAAAHAQTAARINRQRFGDTGAATWPVRALMANIAGSRGTPMADSDAQYTAMFDEMEKAGALDTPFAIDARSTQIAMHANNSDNSTVIKMITQLLPRARRVDGDDSVSLVKLDSMLGNSLAFSRRLDEADVILRARLAKPPIADPAYPVARLDVQQNLAYVLRKRDKPNEAIPLQKETLDAYTKLLGREHPDTLHSMNEYAGMLQDAGRYEESADLFREVLEIRLKRDGEENYKARTSMNNLGLALFDVGKLDEAEQWLQRTYDLELRLQGPDARDTLHAANHLANTKRCRGNIDGALRLQRDVVARAPAAFGADRPDLAILRYGFALTLIAAKDFDGAKRELTSARTDLVRLLGADHARVHKIDERLAELDRDPVLARTHAMTAAR